MHGYNSFQERRLLDIIVVVMWWSSLGQIRADTSLHLASASSVLSLSPGLPPTLPEDFLELYPPYNTARHSGTHVPLERVAVRSQILRGIFIQGIRGIRF